MDFKKRLLIFFCTVVLTVSIIAIPALAVSVDDEYLFTYQSSIGAYANMEMSALALGDYLSADIYIKFSDQTDFSFLASISGEFVDFSSRFGEGAIGFTSGYYGFGQAASPFGGKMSVVILPGASSTTDATVKLVIKSLSKDTAVNALNDAFNTLILWVSMVVSGVISGPMNGLLLVFAIGIAITFVVVSVKLIRKFIWGA